MKIRLTTMLIASGLVFAVPGVRAAAEIQEPMVITEAGISHVSGGVGDEELQVIESMARDFNLRLLMAMKNGEYLADVDVAITDRRGNKLIATVAEGPYLLARLPPGKYDVTASVNGETRHQRVDVGRTGQREVQFRW